MLESIDPSEALKLAGVIDFVSSTDVPGLNDVSAFTCAPLPNSTKIKPYQPVFVPIGQEVVFVGQPLGLIVATSRELAEQAALLVTATYEDSDGNRSSQSRMELRKNHSTPQITTITSMSWEIRTKP